jgi:hypothetical protein
MRYRSSLRTAVVAAAITLSACGGSSESPLGPTAPSLATRSDHSNVWESFFLADLDNPCTPAVEAVDLEGKIHGQGSIWDNDHFKSHYDVNLTGVDADGVRYEGTSSGNGKGEFPGSETEDVVISTVITSQGATPNFVTKIVLHHHKDGTITVDKAGDECRGTPAA